VVTIGTFDGVHAGHQAILSYLGERAAENEGHSTLVTFDPHPRAVVHREEVALLTTPGERADECARFGVHRFIVLPFDTALAGLSPEAFVKDILVGRIGLREIVIGYNHAFGRDRRGNRELLERIGEDEGFGVDVIPKQLVEGRVASSSSIRRMLREEGDVLSAEALLGRPYRIAGRVVEGARRGRTLGYPTANLVPDDPRKLIPRRGVYAVQVGIENDSVTWPAMMNIGQRPTFSESEDRIEIHLLGFQGDLYGRRLIVDFVERMRPERKFPSIDALVAQLREDEARCRALLRSVS
jgi:riboflavin kinase/FMN adenylyltransferase